MEILSARPTLAIGIVILGSFAISFTLRWHGRHPPGPAVAIAAATAPGVSTLEAGGPQTRTAEMREAVPVPSAGRRELAVPAPVVNAPVGDVPDATGPLPVAISVFNRRNRHRIEGTVVNTSTTRLTLTLEVVAAEGRGNSTISLDLPPGGQQQFSNEFGLDIQSKDHVILHSDSFPDLTAEVP